MRKTVIMRLLYKILFVLLLFSIMLVGFWQLQWDLFALEMWIADNQILGIVAYVIIVSASVVFLPFSSLPLLPLATRVFGVWLTAWLSILGWWIGSLFAFQIARLSRRYLEKIASLDAIDTIERKIPKDIGFAGIIILRMIFPVDVTSFALGLLKKLSFSTYAIASLIGIMPFAFVWSYAGGELGKGAFFSSTAVFIGMIIVVLVIRRIWQKQ